jgi:hypothetical protein
MTKDERIAESKAIYMRGQLDACESMLDTVAVFGAENFTAEMHLAMIRDFAEMARPLALHVPELKEEPNDGH